jgi:flagellar hook-basal body complex protein FliE
MEVSTKLVAQTYAQAKKPQASKEVTPDPVNAATAFAATMAEGESVAKSTMMGGADPHSLVRALAQTELAVETAVTVRNKVVEAYQEILRMPV